MKRMTVLRYARGVVLRWDADGFQGVSLGADDNSNRAEAREVGGKRCGED